MVKQFSCLKRWENLRALDIVPPVVTGDLFVSLWASFAATVCLESYPALRGSQKADLFILD